LTQNFQVRYRSEEGREIINFEILVQLRQRLLYAVRQASAATQSNPLSMQSYRNEYPFEAKEKKRAEARFF
jgi:hypothetical protein